MDSEKQSNVDMSAMLWLDELKKLADRFKVPGIDFTALAEWQRKDMEAFVEANRQAYEGIKVLVTRRNEILQETLAQWQSGMKDVAGADTMSKQADVAKQSVEKAMVNLRELSELEAQAHSNAWKVVQERMQENLGTLQKLLQPK